MIDGLTLKTNPSEATFVAAKQLKIVSQIDSFMIVATRNKQYVLKSLCA